jgi:hypothetical protein
MQKKKLLISWWLGSKERGRGRVPNISFKGMAPQPPSTRPHLLKVLPLPIVPQAGK